MYMGWGLVGHTLLVLDLVLAILYYIIWCVVATYRENTMDREAQSMSCYCMLQNTQVSQ